MGTVFLEKEKTRSLNILLKCTKENEIKRRILRTKEEYIYVAGETENKCYRLTKDVVIAKAIARERNNKSYRASYDTVLQSFSKKVQIQIIEENHCIMYTYLVRLEKKL